MLGMFETPSTIVHNALNRYLAVRPLAPGEYAGCSAESGKVARVTIELGEQRRVLVEVTARGKDHAYIDLADELLVMTREAEIVDAAQVAMEGWLEANAPRESNVSPELVRELPLSAGRQYASLMWRWRSGTHAPEWSVYLHDEPYWHIDTNLLSFYTPDAEAAKAAYLTAKFPE